MVDAYIEQSGCSAKNREHFESELLSIATRNIGYGLFHIKKSTLERGKCWVSSCADIQDTMNQHVRDNDCDSKCYYVKKNMDTYTKLNDLFDNSILRDSKVNGLLRRNL